MRVPTAVVCALVGCGGAGAPIASPPGNAGQPAPPCDPDALLREIDAARTRAHLGRLGAFRFGARGRVIADGGGTTADEPVPVLAERDGRLKIAIAGDGVIVVGWIDRADVVPVTLVEHRVGREPGARPPAGGLGVTVLPGHPTTGETRGSSVRVRGHGGLAFDGWIPDDTAETWEVAPPPDAGDAELVLSPGTQLVDDPSGAGAILATLTQSRHARLLESVALGADKVEVVTADARATGYAARPQLPRSTAGRERVFDFSDVQLEGEIKRTAAVRACLHDGPGGAVAGVVNGGLVSIAPADVAGWAETPIATPWGEVVLALRAPSWLEPESR